ncbi:MAG: hypothetical protein U0Q07_18475 [Acidimicrobiales bacterium]
MPTPTSLRVAAISGALAAGGLFGALVAAPAISSAQTTTAPAQQPATAQQQAPAQGQTPPQGQASPQGQRPQGAPQGFDKAKGGHVGQNGTKEELLTGDTATKVTDAAKAAVPDGTVDRVETDAEGAAYEAHVTKADGSEVTVKLDASFAVTSIENGPA